MPGSVKQVVGATGQLGSHSYKLQNMPIRTEEGRRVRSAFIPGEAGWKLVSADYSQIELRIHAHYSHDKALQQAFAPPGIDLETDLLSCRRYNRLFLEIDADPSCTLREFDFGGEAIDDGLADDDRQNAVLETIGEKDVTEA